MDIGKKIEGVEKQIAEVNERIKEIKTRVKATTTTENETEVNVELKRLREKTVALHNQLAEWKRSNQSKCFYIIPAVLFYFIFNSS